jgi:hypothetical protein
MEISSACKLYIFIKPRLHEQILFDKFNTTNAFYQKLVC